MGFEKVVVTGGSGRLGQFVVDRLAAKSAVTVLDLKPPAQPRPNVRFINADITDHAALTAAFKGQDAVIHLAAIPNPRTAPAAVLRGLM